MTEFPLSLSEKTGFYTLLKCVSFIFILNISTTSSSAPPSILLEFFEGRYAVLGTLIIYRRIKVDLFL